jgi:monoamine oxidase
MEHLYDAIIVGAGIAGIRSALELTRANKEILLLEARSRIGGRILTEKDGLLPLELGPEFIHGNPDAAMRQALGEENPFLGITDHHHFFRGRSRKEIPHFWEDMQKITKRIGRRRVRDTSVQDFLDSVRSLNKKKRDLFRAYVEGFHAANPEIMSALSLFHAEEKGTDEGLNGQEQFRPLNGYQHFVDSLFQQDARLMQSALTSMVLKRVAFRAGHVALRCRNALTGTERAFRCRQLVLTLPIGVLKAPAEAEAGIAWEPEMPEALSKGLSGIEMGHVQKLVFQFRSRFWEKGFDKEPSFFHAGPENHFPTWWALAPLRTFHLIAWQGGPLAQEMKTWSEEGKAEAALRTLGSMFGKSRAFLRRELVGCLSHDWSHDPFSLGAYSYVRTGGWRASHLLGQRINPQLIVAGEGAVSGANRGTVMGALESGLKAARLVLAAVSRGEARAA